MNNKSRRISEWRLSSRHSFCIRSLNIRLPGLFAAAVLLLVPAVCSVAAPVVKQLADGVTLTQEINTDPASAMVVNILRVDPKVPGVRIVTSLAQDGVIEPDVTKGRERVSSIVARKGAVAGVNADFFPFTGDPLGLAIMGGELISEPMNRAAVGITSSGEVIFDRMSFSGTITAASGATYKLGGLNRQRGKNEILLFTPVYGASTGTASGVEVSLKLNGPVKPNSDLTATLTSDPGSVVNSTIPGDQAILSSSGPGGAWMMQNLHRGDTFTLRFDIKSASGRSWNNIAEAIGGGPMLVKDGETCIDAEEESFKASFCTVKHPRTAVGVTSTGTLIFVTADGRQDISKGMTLAQLAWLMKRLGAVNAMNLDGGGSTSISVRGAVINSPSEALERPIADALLIYANQSTGPEVKFCQTGPLVISSGAPQVMAIAGVASDSPAVVWGTTGGVGFINQKGYFIPVKARKGTIVAISNGNKTELPVVVVAGKPTTLTAKIGPDPSGATNRGQVTVTLEDTYGNANTNVSVTLAIKGGLADSASAITDDKGTAIFNVTWDTVSADAVITVSAAGLTAKAK